MHQFQYIMLVIEDVLMTVQQVSYQGCLDSSTECLLTRMSQLQYIKSSPKQVPVAVHPVNYQECLKTST
ncbi:hypothetical protein DPMN_097841 [Dreissena polymorpha]|uniref:Uncharacterized protein n=1 Tax=Dreissena polymorpha TaxID=45954 RepID=A0A9D4LBW1_DREPO|nr:hypothetical protein DPMN_097841 [Dreissena polymorpha]